MELVALEKLCNDDTRFTLTQSLNDQLFHIATLWHPVRSCNNLHLEGNSSVDRSACGDWWCITCTLTVATPACHASFSHRLLLLVAYLASELDGVAELRHFPCPSCLALFQTASMLKTRSSN